MKNSIIRRLVALGTVAIIGMLAIQSYWVVSTWNINDEEFNNKVTLALHRVAKDLVALKGGTLPQRNIIKRKTSNYYIVNIEDEIDANNLEFFLQREFEALALNIDFEYAVYDCEINEMVYWNFCSNTLKDKKKLELGNLPKYDEFTYYFGVKFPTRSEFLFGKMQLTILFSSLLLVTILFFSYSLFVILRQKHLSDVQKDFINNMTHEFKTPISTIKVSADVFLKAPVVKNDPRLSRYAAIIQEQNTRLNNQVEKVLQLANLDKGQVKLNIETFNLKEVLQSVMESTKVQIEKRNGILESEIGAADVSIKADKLHFTNIVHNLLDNAIKYCQNVPTVKLFARQSDRTLIVSIEDKGIGIPKDSISRVFNKFYRVPTGNIHNVKGFGLGLYYVKSICEAHGWKIGLSSKFGVGTKVQIAIPIGD